MPMRLCSYNVEHFNRLFQRGTNNLSVTADDQQRIQDLGAVLQAIDADLVGIVEAPNTTTSTPPSRPRVTGALPAHQCRTTVSAGEAYAPERSRHGVDGHGTGW